MNLKLYGKNNSRQNIIAAETRRGKKPALLDIGLAKLRCGLINGHGFVNIIELSY